MRAAKGEKKPAHAFAEIAAIQSSFQLDSKNSSFYRQIVNDAPTGIWEAGFGCARPATRRTSNVNFFRLLPMPPPRPPASKMPGSDDMSQLLRMAHGHSLNFS